MNEKTIIMVKENTINIELLSEVFKKHRDKIICTSNGDGKPNICIMGNPRVTEYGNIEFEISGKVSVTLDNLKENKNITFMVYTPGERAIDYRGVRVQTKATEVHISGEKFESIKEIRRQKHGEARAEDLLAYVICEIEKIRPIVDRGQFWEEVV